MTELEKGLYKKLLGVQCDLSTVALREVYYQLGPADIYTIYCGRQAYDAAVRIQRAVMSQSIDHPFAPTVNVYPQAVLSAYEWYVVANDKSVGSAGV